MVRRPTFSHRRREHLRDHDHGKARIACGGVALPKGVTFLYDGNGHVTLSGTPAPETAGTYCDLVFTASEEVPIGQIRKPLHAPITQNFRLSVE